MWYNIINLKENGVNKMAEFRKRNYDVLRLLLRQKRYAFIDYNQCVAEAKEHGYDNPEDYSETAFEAELIRDKLQWIDKVIEREGFIIKNGRYV